MYLNFSNRNKEDENDNDGGEEGEVDIEEEFL